MKRDVCRDERLDGGMLSVVERVLVAVHKQAMLAFGSQQKPLEAGKEAWDVRVLLKKERKKVQELSSS